MEISVIAGDTGDEVRSSILTTDKFFLLFPNLCSRPRYRKANAPSVLCTKILAQPIIYMRTCGSTMKFQCLSALGHDFWPMAKETSSPQNADLHDGVVSRYSGVGVPWLFSRTRFIRNSYWTPIWTPNSHQNHRFGSSRWRCVQAFRTSHGGGSLYQLSVRCLSMLISQSPNCNQKIY